MERIERHDIINAVILAVVLLAMALALVFGARSLFRTVTGGELVDAVETPQTVPATVPDSTESTDPVEETTTTLAQPHPNGEVKVRVGNAASRGGIAGAGTRVLDQAGYDTLGAKNADSPSDTSIVYYIDGYQADAAQAARLLGVPEVNIAPMPADPGVPIEDAMLVVILGADTTVG